MSVKEQRPRPLAGRRIVVTRSREQASALTRRLEEQGAKVVEIPTIATVPPQSYEPLDAALAELGAYDWLVVTSANTARVLRERLEVLDVHPVRLPQTVAVGPATAAALRAVGFRVDLVPEPAVAESIVAALRERVAGQRVLLVRAEVGRDLLPRALADAGARVTVAAAYRTVPDEESVALVARLFAAGAAKVDALTFTSSSTARNFFALLERAGLQWPPQPRVFSIGPITSATLRDLGAAPHYEAVQHDVQGLVDGLLLELAAR
ncbi:MAG TPA: uroporphyrinogen-III synthase [Acidobacteriaceae bacterium]